MDNVGQPFAPPRSSSRQNGSMQNAPANPVGVNIAAKKSERLHPFGNAPYYPAGDAQTYRDLLIFEERLKQNAARLIKRKKKYQSFLVLLCGVIGIFSYCVFINPHAWQPLHYFNVTVLLITATMLLLFFASGMYSERITAANKFVPQANRSLRSYNLYLNTRTAPRQSLMSFLRYTPAQRSTANIKAQSLSSAADGSASEAMGGAGVQMQRIPSNGNGKSHLTIGASGRRFLIPAIPPSSNPRGELIFGSKVSSSFRVGYERYRAAFERRRREKMEERRRSGWRRWWNMFGSPASAAPSGSSEGFSQQQDGMHSSLRSNNNDSVRSSPRSTRTRTRIPPVMAGAHNHAGNGSENNSASSSRASSPTSSPKVPGNGLASVSPSGSRPGSVRQQRGRQAKTLASAIDFSSGDASTSGERQRGRDRTPSVTAVSHEHLVRRSSQVAAAANVQQQQQQSAALSAPSQDLHGIIGEERVHEDASDAAAADAMLGHSIPNVPPDPAQVAAQADNRQEEQATLREPIT